MWATCSSSRTPSAMCKKAGWMDELQELSWWHDITGKAVDLMTWQPQKSPAFFCFKSTCCTRSGTGNRTAGGGRAISDGYSQEAPRGGVGMMEVLPKGRYAEKKDNSWVVENLYMAVAIYPPMAISMLIFYMAVFTSCWKKNTWHLSNWFQRGGWNTSLPLLRWTWIPTPWGGTRPHTWVSLKTQRKRWRFRFQYGNMVWMVLIILLMY